MIPVAKLKKEVYFNADFTATLDVLKGIAAARYHILQKQMVLFERFFTVAGEFFSTVDLSTISHPFVRPQVAAKSVVLITSDAGFLGGLNNQVVSKGVAESANGGKITVLGDRGAGLLREFKVDFTPFTGLVDAKRMEMALKIRDHVVSQVLRGETGGVVVIYPKPTSFTVQEVVSETFIPCTAWIPKGNPSKTTFIWESTKPQVLEYVVFQWIAQRLNAVLALSRLAELAARTIHLEGSHLELKRIGKHLKHQYLRARHEVIDRSMREIYSSAQLLKAQDEDD